jgi:hypothetical protein
MKSYQIRFVDGAIIVNFANAKRGLINIALAVATALSGSFTQPGFLLPLAALRP